jgi:superfamily II DNA helicase RecQ
MPYQPLESLDPERVRNAEETLCKVFGLDSLRDFQVEASQNLLKGFHTILDVPTGAGKTLAFWYPLFYHIGDWEKRALCTKCLLLIGPLTALLKSQRKTLENVGIPAVCLNSEDGNMEEEMEVCIISYSSMS